MAEQQNDDWIDGLMRQAAQRAATETPDEQQARLTRTYRETRARLGLPPFEGIDGKVE